MCLHLRLLKIGEIREPKFRFVWHITLTVSEHSPGVRQCTWKIAHNNATVQTRSRKRYDMRAMTITNVNETIY